MSHLYEARAYTEAPRAKCAWGIDRDWPGFSGEGAADVAIIGAGFTGLSAALTLAEAGVCVTVLEAQVPGWGASGRNGGFCCIGGTALPDAMLTKRFGTDGARAFLNTQLVAIDHVSALIERHALDVQRHSDGEVLLAHSARAAKTFADEARACEAQGLPAQVLSKADLDARGLGGPGFHAGLHLRKGFGLDAGAYVTGLAHAARAAGARIYGQSPVQSLDKSGDRWHLTTPAGTLTANRILVATNGYTQERLGPLRAPVLPIQSNVLVTRPLTQAELAAQGWTSDLMAYDARSLLHYFRLMSDGRFLFGMRGGIRATARAETRTNRRLLAHFHAMFPAWRHVDIPHTWSGLLAYSRDLMPHVTEIGGDPSALAAMAYHGNGVAMGTWSGHAAAHLMLGDDIRPAPMRTPLTPFPLAPLRRNILRLGYPLAAIRDAL
ncbi:NAD(P)/FAD-dependent oxidoreductase [Maritimibacter alexandrii]|uniref:NAD(P)/FAD-dependent oxidoreductase n=1 Tax=Maritimibacter alexandrii TaxID=2570355 RepID=UPI0014862F3A|nr:FAD-binding oxidoreductase [Maritimibacter alexandrii]